MSDNKQVQRSTQNLQQTDSGSIERFPFRRFFFLLTAIFLLLSLFSISLESDPSSNNWKINTTISVSTITLTLLLIIWMPVIIPWLISLSPRLRSSLEWLRAGGVEEVEAGGIRMKLVSLAKGVAEAAEVYENKIGGRIDTEAGKTQTAEGISKLYSDMVDKLETDDRISRTEALQRIDQLAEIYNQVRYKMKSSSERTQLLSQIAATMWSLMPSVEYFNAEERLTSYDGGVRLSAYKFIEWKPQREYLNLTLSRSVGVLESPFGQYNALLALQRIISNEVLDVKEVASTLALAKWSSELPYIGSERRYLLRNIISILENN